MPRRKPDWLPSDDDDLRAESPIPWPDSSPARRAVSPVSDSSLPDSSPPGSISPFDSGQRIDSSDPGVDKTDPLIGDEDTQDALRREKAQRKRALTLQRKQEAAEAASKEKESEEAAHRAQKERERIKQEQADIREQRDTCERLLGIMSAAGISLDTFLLYVLDPSIRTAGLRNKRWLELFADPSTIERILTFWTSSPGTPQTARDQVNAWMVSHVARLAYLESRAITEAGWMRSPPAGFSKKDALDFRFDTLYPRFEHEAPVTLEILRGFATARRQATDPGSVMQQRKVKVLTQVTASLLREHSRRNDLVAAYNGLYLYASGAQRQTISVLSHAGWSCSYPRLIDRIQPTELGNNPTPPVQLPPPADETSSKDALRRKGIIPALSASCVTDAQELAKDGHYKTTYDNVNFTENVAEQIVGRKDAQQNMTNAAAAPLHANGEDIDIDAALDLDAAEAAFLAAPPLDIADLMFTADEAKLWEDLLIHSAAEIVIDHGPDVLERFRVHLEASAPVDEHAISVHRTSLYPLQTMDIDEALITGNIDVVDEIHLQLGVDLHSPESSGQVRLFFGDQLTIARQRSIIAARAGHEHGAESWRWAKSVLALFHTDMAAVSCVLSTHFGNAETGTRDPGSLWYHNSHLDRKPIVLTSLPPYRVCRDLISVSLYSRILHCLCLVTNESDLGACARSISTWQQLHSHARSIYTNYASVGVISELRRARTAGEAGDVVFENAVLFLRDALGLRTFGRAVKTGRSGHILLALKWLAMMFKAGGHPKYAREMLSLIHHLTHVWPPKLRALVLSNWLVNPTGKRDGWVALDLMQEHLNFWIKRIYAAHGSNRSWEWLAMISPCIDVLRGVANQMHASLGSYQGRKHTSPNLARDVKRLMDDLAAKQVYTRQTARPGASDVEPVTDLLTEGFQQMVYGSDTALSDYNEEFKTLQARCRVKPLQPFKEGSSLGDTVAPTLTPAERAAALSGRSSTGATASPEAAQVAHTGGGNPGAADAEEAEEQSIGHDSDGETTSTSSGSNSSIPDEFQDYDELFLRLADEYDVELDLDSTQPDEEDSEDEHETGGPNESLSNRAD